MKLQRFSIERYKGFAESADVEVAPLTILVGPNNAGKSVLARAIQLLAGGLNPSDKDTAEPLPLKSGGVRHGDTFRDLVTGRSVHHPLTLSVNLANGSDELSLSATVGNVSGPDRPSEERQISHWSLCRGRDKVDVDRQGFDKQSSYTVSIPETERKTQQIGWQGLIPRYPDKLAHWMDTPLSAIRDWAGGVRYLQCPRSLGTFPFSVVDQPPSCIGSQGQHTPLILAADDDLRERVRNWYRRVFGVSLDIRIQGDYADLMVGMPARGTKAKLAQSGRGIANVLPVVVMAETARTAGPGVDVVEHPEAKLHPAAHANIAELLLHNLAGPERPLIIETHSEMLLLRARRWVAEKRLATEDVLVYWVHTQQDRGSILQKIRIDEHGGLSDWPSGVFTESYEEILAIRRAVRRDE